MDKIKKNIRKTIQEIVSKVFKCDSIKITPEIKQYVQKFKSSEELLRSGGIPTNLLDKAAFGFNEKTKKTINPKELNVKWKDDLENVEYERKHKHLTPIEYAKTISLKQPIDVSYENIGEGNKFYVEDGHHRYYAAKILEKPLKINLQIKINPIKELSNNQLGYDDFHRCLFDRIKNISEVFVDDKHKISHILNDTKKIIIKKFNCSISEINNGFCFDFAQIAKEKMENNNINAEILTINDFFDIYEDNIYGEEQWNFKSLKKYNSLKDKMFLKKVANIFLNNNIDHHWIFVNNKHYDADEIYGVDSFWELPFFKKYTT